jgi:hypothetical protein
MPSTPARLSAAALITGSVVATVGYAAAFAANGNGDVRFTGSSWTGLYMIALFGDVIVLLGLPALLAALGDHSRRLNLFGYVGLFVPLAVLNVGEGCVEGFVKPYLAKHGGIPKNDLPGLSAFELPAVVIMLVGMVCLGVAVWRAGTLPKWIAVAFVVVPFLGAGWLKDAASLTPDYLLFAALTAVGISVLRSSAPATAPVPAHAGAQAALS